MKFQTQNSKSKVRPQHYFFLCVLISCVLLAGCDAFVRKFTRKPKKDTALSKEMVLVPEQYPSLFANREEEYRYYFLLWQSWHSEFIQSLEEKTSHKKKLFCIAEAIKNLNILKNLLLEEKAKALEKYVRQLEELKNDLSRDIYTTQFNWYYNRAEVLRKNILRSFSYPKIKDYLK